MDAETPATTCVWSVREPSRYSWGGGVARRRLRVERRSPRTEARLFRVGQALAGAVRRTGLRAEGVNLFLADGEAAGQEVFHTHLHVLPRFAGDGFRLQVTSGSPSRDELDEVAGRIRAEL